MTSPLILKSTGDVTQDTQNLMHAITQHMHVHLVCDNYVPFRINRTLELTRNGQRVSGINPWATVIEWCGDPTNACVFKICQAQYVSVQDIMIRPGYWHTDRMVSCEGGYAIHVTGHKLGAAWLGSAYVCIQNVCVFDMWNGMHVEGGAEHRLTRVQLRALRGTCGILFKAEQKSHSLYRCIVEDLVADAAHYANTQIKWINFNSYSYSLRIDGAALMHGGHGIHMGDDVAAGDSYPMWVFANDLECDHNHSHAVQLCAGEGFQCGESWLGSSMTGCGLVTCLTWRGDLALTTTRIYGNAQQGVRLDVGKVTQMASMLVGDNSAQQPSAHAGIQVGAACSHVRISGYSGDCVGVSGNNQSYGVLIARGAQHVDVSDLNVTGNQLAGYADHTTNGSQVKLPHTGPCATDDGWLCRLWRWIMPL